MFTNLIESNADKSAFRRRSSFFLITVAGYALILFAAGIAGVLTYDARVEAQNNDLSVLDWIPPVVPTNHVEPAHTAPAPRRSPPSTALVDQHITTPERTEAVAPTTDPTKVPDNVGIKRSDTPPVSGPVVISNRNADPPPSNDTGSTCASCPSTATTTPVVTTPPPTPTPRPPTTETVSSRVLVSKAVSLPQPPYPQIAKQAGIQGPVNVQILIDESGKVISAHAVSGSAMLTRAAEDAARRARFTPTKLNDQPVKVQGVITYNFVLQ